MSKFDLSNIAIIGCGTVGANLAINVISKLDVRHLKLFDYDIVSGQTSPFQASEIGLHKAIVTRGLCLIENPNIECDYILDRVTDNSKLYGCFVIDCRDAKLKNINSDVRISLDGKYMCIDSRSDYIPSKGVEYIFPRDERCIEESISILMKYFQEERYLDSKIEYYILDKGDTKFYAKR